MSIRPGAKPKVNITQASLDDFYARLVVAEDGKLNFAGNATAPTLAASATSGPPTPSTRRSDLPVDGRVDGSVLTNGRIDFSDRFVRPNYSAALTGLTGRLATLRSDNPEPAALSLRGKAAGTALLEIEGVIDPVSRPFTFDLRAKATDLELAPLSPYAGKYTGYAIERGKLSMDVSYRLGADGRLDAKNQVVLHQLTFGRKIESPTATRLPVLLAVALLKDREGVIDLDLPISGSLQDPQFSVTGVIGRLLGNMLVKAVTSPFSLLTAGESDSADGAEPGTVSFITGTTRRADEGRAVLDKVAAALAAKPNLIVTITGAVNTEAERSAYRGAVLEDRLLATRRKQTVASASASAGVALEPPLEPALRVRLLKQLYSDSDLPDKPLNVLGFAKDVPAEEMEARLVATIPADADAMRALALQRGVAVREALIEKGLSSDRLFLAAPQVQTEGAGGSANAGLPRAELSLSLR